MADEASRRAPREGIHVRVTVPERVPILAPEEGAVVDERAAPVPEGAPRVDAPRVDEPEAPRDARVVESQETALERFRRFRAERRGEPAPPRQPEPGQEASPERRKMRMPWSRPDAEPGEDTIIVTETAEPESAEPRPPEEQPQRRRMRMPWKRDTDEAPAAAEASTREAPAPEPVESEATPEPEPTPPPRGFTTLEVRAVVEEEPRAAPEEPPATAVATLPDEPVRASRVAGVLARVRRARERDASKVASEGGASSGRSGGLLARFPRRGPRARVVAPLDLETLPAPPPTPPLAGGVVGVPVAGEVAPAEPERVEVELDAPAEATPKKARRGLRAFARRRKASVPVEGDTTAPEPAIEAGPEAMQAPPPTPTEPIEEERETAAPEPSSDEPRERRGRFGRGKKSRTEGIASEAPLAAEPEPPAPEPVMEEPLPEVPPPHADVPVAEPPLDYGDLVRRVERTLREHQVAPPRVISPRRR